MSWSGNLPGTTNLNGIPVIDLVVRLLSEVEKLTQAFGLIRDEIRPLFGKLCSGLEEVQQAVSELGWENDEQEPLYAETEEKDDDLLG